MESSVTFESDLHFKATELRLGLPGTDESEKQTLTSVRNNKRATPHTAEDGGSEGGDLMTKEVTVKMHPLPTQVVGWPPIRSYRKNSILPKKTEAETGMYVKVSMDGAPYLRKIDLKVYEGYPELLKALENMFKLTIGDYSEREGYKGSEYEPTYEDKDGDWMLVGDVPWDMFATTCKRLRIMKGSEAKGLGCRV
ncbi:Auxin-induced protein 22B [Camellia lanceoleosa]|uniref:Auxin-induced protein 22B n=1 Tax=Camellia lanceoleosa TaxID=1840588 RepID=A0ACC0GT03_9ERIC|nr:Auxin-induced protein 22B [Camellia lanceoleosa]